MTPRGSCPNNDNNDDDDGDDDDDAMHLTILTGLLQLFWSFQEKLEIVYGTQPKGAGEGKEQR